MGNSIIFKITICSQILPFKFCTTRWLENCNVVTRAIELLTLLKTFVNQLVKNKSELVSARYKKMVKSLKNPILGL